ncbi:PTS sugar transporter subunit IIB [Anaerofustis sp.]|uniref:PTS sugar transporter subunit IIB n=1 Tax=Anaerofustis sp. TaxID=1872517 RepID=UPI0025BF5369|nr:PTS sugar transporter subunit IIB [Anaerofustis sp.]
MKIDGVVLVRIDDRLIHGQVMTSWLNYTGANKIMVIDDEVANDPFMKNVLKTCVPGNVRIATFTVEKAAKRLKMEKAFTGDKCIILVKFPKTLYELMKQGIIFDEINIGGMGVRGERKKFFRNISASDEEKRMLKEMVDAGSKIHVRIIAEDSKTDISKML